MPSFIDYIRREIKQDVAIVNTTLAMAQKIDTAVGNKEYDCDKYVSDIKNASGGTEAQLVYFMGYEAGKLVQIETIAIKDDKEYPINKLSIKKLESSIPENGFVIDGSAEVYAAGIGDMDDLLEKPVKVGTFGGGTAK